MFIHFQIRKPRAQDSAFSTPFVQMMRSIQADGASFELVAREALAAKLGEGPSEVLFMSIGKAACADPESFALAMRKMFGEGAQGILEPIMSRVRMGYFPKSEADEARRLESYIIEHPSRGQLGGILRKKTARDHRVRDEFGDHVDEDD